MEKTRLSWWVCQLSWQPHIQPTAIRQRPDRAERTPPAPRHGGEVERSKGQMWVGFELCRDQTAEHPLEN